MARVPASTPTTAAAVIPDSNDGRAWFWETDTRLVDGDTLDYAARRVNLLSATTSELPAVQMELRCNDGVFSVAFYTLADRAIVASRADDSTTMRFRIDHGVVHTERWADPFGAPALRPRSPSAFVAQLIGHDTLRIEERSLTGEVGGAIALDGLDQQLDRMRRRCPAVAALPLGARVP